VQIKAELKPHEGVESTCIALSVRLNLLASAGDSSIVIFDLPTMKKETALTGFSRITALAFLESDALLAAGCETGTISLWRVRPYAWQCIAAFENACVSSFRFVAPYLMSADVDGKLRAWGLDMVDFTKEVDVSLKKRGVHVIYPCSEEAVDYTSWCSEQTVSASFVTEVERRPAGFPLPLVKEVEAYADSMFDIQLDNDWILITTGERQTKIWSRELVPLGTLSQRAVSDGNWHFPCDVHSRREKKLKNAEDLLSHLEIVDTPPLIATP